jgi:hypothetical protein
MAGIMGQHAFLHLKEICKKSWALNTENTWKSQLDFYDETADDDADACIKGITIKMRSEEVQKLLLELVLSAKSVPSLRKSRKRTRFSLYQADILHTHARKLTD